MTCISTRNVFYDTGRELNATLLGKKVIMTEPYLIEGRLDYTFMPNTIENAFTLVGISFSSAVVERGGQYYYVCKEALTKWLPVEDFLNLHKVNSFTHYIHYGFPV